MARKPLSNDINDIICCYSMNNKICHVINKELCYSDQNEQHLKA